MIVKAYKILGTTADVDTCERCGRTNLKRTVALESIDGGRVFHVGTVCGSRLAKLKAKDFRREVKAVESAQARNKRIADNRAHRAAMASWESFLAETTGITDVVNAIDALGGFVKARAAYRLATTPTA